MQKIILSIILVALSSCAMPAVQKSTKDFTSGTQPEITPRSYNRSQPSVAQAVVNAMVQLGWSINYSRSNIPYTVVADVPMSLWTGGDAVEVSLTEKSEGQTIVDITSRTVGQLYDWGKNKENIARFYGALDATVALQPETVTSSGAARPKLPNAVIVTAGPLSQPYATLGEVHVDTRGMVNLGSMMNEIGRASCRERV